jgi:hypothetical protein
MKRAGIPADDASRVAQQSHELDEGAIVRGGIGFSAGRFHGSNQFFFTWAEIQDATKS